MKATLWFGLLMIVAVSGAAIENTAVNKVPVASRAPTTVSRPEPSPAPVATNPAVVQKTTPIQTEPSSSVVQTSTVPKPATTAVKTTNSQPIVQEQSFSEVEKTVNGKTEVEIEKEATGQKPVIETFSENAPGHSAGVSKSAWVGSPNAESTATRTTSGNKPAVATAFAEAQTDDDSCSCEDSVEDNYYPSYPTYPGYQSMNPFLYPQYGQYNKPHVNPGYPIPSPGYPPHYPGPNPHYPSPYPFYPSNYPSYPSNYPSYPRYAPNYNSPSLARKTGASATA